MSHNVAGTTVEVYTESMNKEVKPVTDSEARKRGLTIKEQEYVNKRLEDKRKSGTQAAIESYGKEGKEITYGTASTISSENMKKPRILAVLADHELDAQQTIITLMKKSRRDDIKLNSAKEVLNRVHGKAPEVIDVTSKGERISPSSTSVVEEFGVWLKQRTQQ